MSFLLVESEFCSDYFLNEVGQAFFSLALRGPLCQQPGGPLAACTKNNIRKREVEIVPSNLQDDLIIK